MQKITPAAIRYIKLGRGGLWERSSIEKGEIHLGYRDCPHEVALSGDRAAIERSFLNIRATEPGARDATRQVLDFYTLGSDCLWITFADGYLWWALAEPEVIPLVEETATNGARMRRTLDGWKNVDVTGKEIRLASLSTKLTKVAAYRQTICTVEAADYLLRKINAEEDPVLVSAQAARERLVETAAALIAGLHWADFETLVDFIFAREGWHRVSALGGTEKDADMVLEQVTTEETAFVQVKASATQRVLDDYLARFDANPAWTRMFFVCGVEKGKLAVVGRPDVKVWTREAMAEIAVKSGLFDWLLARAA